MESFISILYEIKEFIVTLLGILLLALAWYIDSIYPYRSTTLFSKIKRAYINVINGSLSYHAFKVEAQTECRKIMNRDPDEMVSFKIWMIEVLENEEFIQRAFVDPNITLKEFRAKWNTYDPLHYPESLFNEIKKSYQSVIDGQLSYLEFKVDVKNKCRFIKDDDSEEMTGFKKWMINLLDYDNFIQETLLNPHTSLEQFMTQWKEYNLESPVPDLFTKGKGKDIMDMMVKHGYCEPVTLRWKDSKSSYLMGMFSSAIADELGLKRHRRKPFNEIWGNGGKNNLSSLESQALECKDSNQLIKEVQELFPKYKA